MVSLSELKAWFDRHRSQIREDYFRFLRFRSISADPAYAPEMKSCAEWLTAFLAKGGLRSELLPTTSYPIVYAEEKSEEPHAKTLLAYGHYDVQPVDPLNLWESDPFEPVEKKGSIFARGASDNKGQIFYALMAALAWKELGRRLPVHLKFCIEGEEESRSVGLAQSLPSLKKKLKADYLLVIDFDQLPDRTPAISLGARGLAALDVTLIGSSTDLHSGTLGGVAYNPNRALAELLAKLWDAKGRIAIPNFYDAVEKADPSSYTYPYDSAYFSHNFGIEAFGGEKGRSLQESNWFLPTLDINGMTGGYGGAGVKTVIPARATAKLSMRLVPRQDPAKVLSALKEFLEKNRPKGMQIEVNLHEGGTGAWRGHPHSKLAKAISQAANEATGKTCKAILSGASIPIVGDLASAIGAEVVGVGFALDTDRIHAPNEHFDMDRFEKGFLTFGRALALL